MECTVAGCTGRLPGRSWAPRHHGRRSARRHQTERTPLAFGGTALAPEPQPCVARGLPLAQRPSAQPAPGTCICRPDSAQVHAHRPSRLGPAWRAWSACLNLTAVLAPQAARRVRHDGQHPVQPVLAQAARGARQAAPQGEPCPVLAHLPSGCWTAAAQQPPQALQVPGPLGGARSVAQRARLPWRCATAAPQPYPLIWPWTAQIQEKLEAYAQRYHAIKAPRKLVWQPGLGMVTLSLALGPDSKDFAVTPLQASILLFFQVGLTER